MEQEKSMTPQEVLALPLPPNDADAATVGAYLVALAREVWSQEEGFSGKRPFGNSGWQSDIHSTLVSAGLVKGKVDDEGYAYDVDYNAANKIVMSAIDALYPAEQVQP